MLSRASLSGSRRALSSRRSSSRRSSSNIWSSPWPEPAVSDLLLPDYISSNWRDNSGRTAIVEGVNNVSKTYGDYADLTASLAGSLESSFLVSPSGSRTTATIMSPNHVNYLPSILALLRLGAVVSPANPL